MPIFILNVHYLGFRLVNICKTIEYPSKAVNSVALIYIFTISNVAGNGNL